MTNTTTNPLINGILILFLSLMSNSVFAMSNDPDGQLFIQKPAGDLSNCGPIAALMARKHQQRTFKVTNLRSAINVARGDSLHADAYEANTGWWKMRDISNYLTRFGISHNQAKISYNPTQIVNALKRGEIAIVNVNMNHLRFSKGQIGKPYRTFPIPGGWGHYLVIVGFEFIDNQLVFLTHDSFRPKGKNRKFLAQNIMRATQKYFPYALFVHPSSER